MGEAATPLKDFGRRWESKDLDAITDCVSPDHVAHADGDCRIAGGQACVCGEAVQPQSGGRRDRWWRRRRSNGKVVQMGTQQRSSRHTIEVIEKIRGGRNWAAISGEAWYSNTRKSIGVGKEAAVPTTLDWDFVAWGRRRGGRTATTYIHINWHWFRNYGTGESLNNGTHEVDVCRWALGVDFPKRVDVVRRAGISFRMTGSFTTRW